MGKRKSKTSKQKQAKAAGKKFGVSVKKGRDQPKVSVLSLSSSTTLASSSSSSFVKVKKDNKTKNDTNNNKMKQRTNKPFPHKTVIKSNNKAQPTNKNNTNSSSVFRKEMQSAQERSRVAQERRNETVHRRPTFTPAILIVDDQQKSTQRLMDEATHQVSKGMRGIGNAGLHIQQLMTATTHSVPVVVAPSVSSPDNCNPWAALHQADSDDEEVSPPPIKPALFTFAPPSFAVGGGCDDDYIDPDL